MHSPRSSRHCLPFALAKRRRLPPRGHRAAGCREEAGESLQSSFDKPSSGGDCAGSDRSQSGSAACSCKDVFAPILSSCRFNRSLLSCARTKVISRVLAAQSEAVDDNTSPNLCTQFLACMQSKAFRNWSLQRNPNSADCHKFAVQQGFNVRSVPSGLHLAPRLRFAALEACRGDRIIVGRGTRLAPTAHFDRPSLLGSTRTRSRRTQPASRCGRCGLHSLRRLCCSGPPAKSLLPLG